MRTYLDCLPCFVRQTVDAARRLTDESIIHEKLLREILTVAAGMSFDDPPPKMGQLIHRRLRELSGERDPYQLAKREANAFALQLYPELKQKVVDSKDSFTCALKLAIAGNVIDLGVKSSLTEDEVRSSIDAALEGDIESSRS